MKNDETCIKMEDTMSIYYCKNNVTLRTIDCS